jgi:hypothetical protein
MIGGALAVVGAVESILIFHPLGHALGMRSARKRYPQLFDGRAAAIAVQECLDQDGYGGT